MSEHLKQYLAFMVQHEGSDVYLSTGAPPSCNIHGTVRPMHQTPLPPGFVKSIAEAIMGPEKTKQFEAQLEMNLALSIEQLGRFRVNIFKQRGEIAMVIRNIKTDIPSIDQMELPPIFKELILEKRGLILFIGATGSGKSTSLAAMINHRNESTCSHIISIEDPIEYIHPNKQSIINQREVGLDTLTYEDALKNTLRQAPNVILIGEIRSIDTMKHAIAFAETGHLCLSTLHANNSNQALERIINFFPKDQHAQLLMDLSLNLRAFISQRLIPSIDGKRVPAFEILLNSPLISELIRRGDIPGIKELMERSENMGMKTFDSSLYDLHQSGKISFEEALAHADSQNNLKLRISLREGVTSDGSHLSLKLDDDRTSL